MKDYIDSFGYNTAFCNLIKMQPMEIRNLLGVGEQLNFLEYAKEAWNDGASVNDNANVAHNSVMVYEQELSLPGQKINSFYRIWKQIGKQYNEDKANEIIDDVFNGRLYINDSHGISSSKAYCFNFSCYDIMTKGLAYLPLGRSQPPKRLDSFIRQMEQFVTYASNQIKGATGISSFLVCCSFYTKKIRDTLSDGHYKFASLEDAEEYIRQKLISFIYTINQPFRSGVESAFTNISLFDESFIDQLVEDYVDLEGNMLDKQEIFWIQDQFMDVFNEEFKRTGFTFPVLTACVAKDDITDKILHPEFIDWIAKKNLENSCINISPSKTSILSSCCRLQSDTDNEFFNTLGAGSDKIGSIGVCTISLPHVAFESDGKEGFLTEIDRLCRNAFIVNQCKRQIVKETINKGMHPLYSLGYIDEQKQYNTCGVLGFYEMMDILGEDLTSSEFGLEMMDVLTEVNKELSKAYGVPVNCEQIPGESAGVKLSRIDKALGLNTHYEMYSNQFIPLYSEADLFTRIQLDSKYGKRFSGGKILHLSVGETPLHWESLALLYKQIIDAGCPYFALNYQFGMCANGHLISSPKDQCHCGAEFVEYYERVVGFITPISTWNPTRQTIDWPERQRYDL